MSPEVAGTTEAGKAVQAAAGAAVPPVAQVPALPARWPAGYLCRVWALPDGPSCAATARALLADALAAMGLSRATIADTQLVVSELATNALQHAGRYGPHELWLCPTAPGVESLTCGVFDGLAGSRLPEYSWTSGDYGRGLTIVAELTGGQWGMRHAHSRLRPQAPGKVVWFAILAP